MLYSMLSRIAHEYTRERMKPFSKSEFGNFVRRDVVTEARKATLFLPFELKIKASVGQFNSWAAVPWLAFLDPLETTTAQEGIYVVYLINAQTSEIFLSLNQGATSVMRDHKPFKRSLEVLRRQAFDIRDRLHDFNSSFDCTEISLGSDADLPVAYEAGHVFGRRYSAGNIDRVLFNEDLEKMLFAYETLINRGGAIPLNIMEQESGTKEISETRSYALSRRIERSSNVRKEVMARRKPICEACGLDPKVDYSFSGKPLQVPLDVHHSKPISGLAEGETRRYKIPDDFLVLCPNCHRMIHKQQDKSDLGHLKRRIKFRYAREVGLSKP